MQRRLQVTYEFPAATSDEWASKNRILGKDEPGFDTTVGNFKMGNGITPWLELDWFLDLASTGGDGSGAIAALHAHIDSLTPHPVYDDGPSLTLLYENAKV